MIGRGVALALLRASAGSLRLVLGDPRLVLVTPYDSLQDLAAAQFPFFPVRWLLTDKYESGRYAPLVTAPTTIVAAERDEVIPRSSTDRLHARFALGVAKFIVLPGTGHNTISGNPLYWGAFICQGEPGRLPGYP